MTDALATVLDRLASTPLGASVERDAPLGALTTYRVGGSAAALVRIDGNAHADLLAAATGGLDVDIVVIGRGSNMLVSDAGFDGLAVSLGAGFDAIDVHGHDVVAGAAAKLPVVARATVAAGLTGLEWAVGVPGSVGGAVRMNAGGHGADVADCLRSATILDLRAGRRREVAAGDLALAYRSSALTAGDLVLAARFGLEPGPVDGGRAEIQEIIQWRRDNQPGGQNAGSVFTNPAGDSAGRLIDAAGLKGFRIGTAAVSDKHANFIQADAGGRASDVLAVMTEVRRRVADAHGVDLVAETHLVGFGPGAG
ncbi:MAG: UDP-N-acetylenolpyruvoylglucosamine reductase [Acidimicrobiales bacterium]|nr:MAG: UDP-N-acetylenolpyruvoylglucosamine reductase [Acidimicrobiales bacterium]